MIYHLIPNKTDSRLFVLTFIILGMTLWTYFPVQADSLSNSQHDTLAQLSADEQALKNDGVPVNSDATQNATAGESIQTAFPINQAQQGGPWSGAPVGR